MTTGLEETMISDSFMLAILCLLFGMYFGLRIGEWIHKIEMRKQWKERGSVHLLMRERRLKDD